MEGRWVRAPDGNVWTRYDEVSDRLAVAPPYSDAFDVEHVDIDGDHAVIRWQLSAAEPFAGSAS